MSRLAAVPPEKAKDRVKDLYEGISKKLGRVPLIFQNMGNSPAVLEGYLGLNDAVNKTLSPQLREQIALAVGELNQCQYCLSAHTTIGGSIGLSPQEILHARQGEAADPKTSAILKFTKKVVENRAKIADNDVAELKKAGINDAELAEIIMNIVVNIFTNYFNLITDPQIDFPEAPKINSMGK